MVLRLFEASQKSYFKHKGTDETIATDYMDETTQSDGDSPEETAYFK